MNFTPTPNEDERYATMSELEGRTPMSENKWTPEPWFYGFPMQYSTHQDMPATPHPESDPVWLLGGDDYIRAVACVNACVGMVDPAKEIAELRQYEPLLVESQKINHNLILSLAALREQNATMRKALAGSRASLNLIQHRGHNPQDNHDSEWLVKMIAECDAALAKEPTQ